MGDTATLFPPPPSRGTFTPATPSGLTPNTRSEAEAALTLNSSTQTDSAAPTTPLPLPSHTKQLAADTMPLDPHASEAQQAYRRPAPVRTSSTHYEEALLHKARQDSSVSSNFSANSGEMEGDVTDRAGVASPVEATRAFPEPGQGVVPLHTGVGCGQAEAVKKVRPSGLSLGALGRQQSWSEQDMKHIYTGRLLAEPKGDPGYSSGTEGRAVGP